MADRADARGPKDASKPARKKKESILVSLLRWRLHRPRAAVDELDPSHSWRYMDIHMSCIFTWTFTCRV